MFFAGFMGHFLVMNEYFNLFKLKNNLSDFFNNINLSNKDNVIIFNFILKS